MRAAAAVLSVAVLLAAAPSSARLAEQAEVSDSARAALEKAVERMGGDAALAELKSLRMKTKGTYQMGPMAVPYTAETTFAMPDRFVWHLDAGVFKGAMGSRGDTAWSQWMGPPARVKGAMRENMRQWVLTFHITLIRPLLHLEGVKITGGEDEVKVRFPSGETYALTFGDGFLTGFEGDITHWDGRKGTQRATLSEPKKFGEITLPSRTESQTVVNGKVEETMVEEATAIEWNPEIDDDAFAMPAATLELLKASVKQVPEVGGVMLLHEGSHEKIGETILKVYAACQAAGLMAAGAVNAVCLTAPGEVEDPSELRTEVIVPVMVMGPPPELPEGVTMKTLPAAEMASMTARGPYGKADVDALSALMAWVEKNDYEVAGPPRLVYFHNPEMTVAEDMVSEVQVPVRKKKQ